MRTVAQPQKVLPCLALERGAQLPGMSLAEKNHEGVNIVTPKKGRPLNLWN